MSSCLTQICTDICSLKPDFDRLALSVVISVDGDANVMGLPDVFRSVINNKQHFSHAKVSVLVGRSATFGILILYNLG